MRQIHRHSTILYPLVSNPASSHPPGPRGALSPLTNLLALRADPPGFFLQLARQFGPAASFHLGRRRFYFFSGPEAVREVLVSRAGVMRKGFLLRRVWEQLLAIMGNGLLTSEDAFHDRQRRLVVPAFHRERLAGYARIMTDALAGHTARWEDGATLDVAAELSELTLVIVARALFGAELGGSVPAMRGALGTLARLVERMRSPWQRWRYSPAMRTFRQAKAQLDAVVAGIVAERRRQGGDHDDRGDLLSMLLLARDEETGAPGMSDAQVRDEVMTILLAGHETTAGALAWTLHLLGQHPPAEARLHEELDAALPDGRVPGLADLPRLVYTRQVFTESMRLYPPAWVLARQAVEPVEIAGWTLPRGAMCLLSPYATHRDPAWFPEPERFLPERWDGKEESARPKYAYFPFGGGPRACAGEAFAWMEGTLLLAGLARRWRFGPAPGLPLPTTLAAVTLRPRDGVWQRLSRRADGPTAK